MNHFRSSTTWLQVKLHLKFLAVYMTHLSRWIHHLRGKFLIHSLRLWSTGNVFQIRSPAKPHLWRLRDQMSKTSFLFHLVLLSSIRPLSLSNDNVISCRLYPMNYLFIFVFVRSSNRWGLSFQLTVIKPRYSEQHFTPSCLHTIFAFSWQKNYSDKLDLNIN